MLVFVQRVRDKLNSRPRKIVGPQTPREVFFNAKKLPVALRRGTGPWNGRSCVKSGAGDKVEVLKPGQGTATAFVLRRRFSRAFDTDRLVGKIADRCRSQWPDKQLQQVAIQSMFFL